MIDFTNCPIDITANYGGSNQKEKLYIKIYAENGRPYFK